MAAMESLITGPALLFAPAHRAELIPKAYQRADMVIIDLEDGAGDGDRVAMHRTIRDTPLQPGRTILRTCAPDHPGFADDVALAREQQVAMVMVPKLREHIPTELVGLKVIAMVETPQAVTGIAALTGHPDVVGLFWGAEDLITLLGGTHSRFQDDEDTPGAYRDVIRLARGQVLLQAAADGKFAIDAIHADFRDEQGQRREAVDAARSGFAATACIHPAQVMTVRKAYRPDTRQRQWAEQVVAAAEGTDGAFQVEGMMIDAPLVAQARRILARA